MRICSSAACQAVDDQVDFAAEIVLDVIDDFLLGFMTEGVLDKMLLAVKPSFSAVASLEAMLMHQPGCAQVSFTFGPFSKEIPIVSAPAPERQTDPSG
ncbi:MAG: hypothetical protein U5K84_13215 [Alkalibacterium sp.]|nr:hypothetical protein [Alkalibacterium sp.]